jgi:hypothetical protein
VKLTILANLLQNQRVQVPDHDIGCRLPDAARAALTHQELKAEFGDLLTWRDQIFKKHFPN